MATRWPEPRVRGFIVGVVVIVLSAVAGAGVSGKMVSGIATAETATPLRKIAEFELPGPPGKRFDYLTIDEDDNYLLSAHLAAGLLHIINLANNAIVGTVRDVPGAEGVAYIAEGRDFRAQGAAMNGARLSR